MGGGGTHGVDEKELLEAKNSEKPVKERESQVRLDQVKSHETKAPRTVDLAIPKSTQNLMGGGGVRRVRGAVGDVRWGPNGGSSKDALRASTWP